GTLNLIVHSTSERRAQLDARYFPVDGTSEIDLSKKPLDEALVRLPSPRKPSLVGGFAQLRLVFHLADAERVSAADGLLVVQQGDEEAQLAIKGAPQVPRDVSFEPSSVTLNLSRDPWPLNGLRGERAEITLRGDGAGAVADSLKGSTAALTILRNEEGGSVTVSLHSLRKADGTVRGTVEAADVSQVGRYEGALALSGSTDEGPFLVTVVESHAAFGWAVLAVMVGALMGGVIPLQRSIGLRRKQMRAELAEALRVYEQERLESGDAPAGYDIETVEAVGPKPWDSGPSRSEGIRGTLTGIERARTEADLDQAADRVHEVREEVDLWLSLERPLRQARKVLDRLPPDRGDRAFVDTQIYRHAYELASLGSERPAKPEDAWSLLRELRAQMVVLLMFERAWEMDRKLREGKLSAEEERELREIDLDAIDAAAPAPWARSPQELQKLRYELHRATLKLEQVSDTAAHVPSVAAVEDVGSRVSASEEQVDRLIEFVSERPVALTPGRRVKAYINRYDLVWTMVAVAGASAGYALTVYDTGWGTVIDFATAFSAGFGAKVATDQALKLDLSALPMFRPLQALGRLRGAGKGEQPAAPPAAPPAGGAPTDGGSAEPSRHS
ncbi:MAG: hypothetical protein M3131_09955, partial [Actinomycetota bacterium]|nr:hypothetical protein [Actinomycetota bacterium]